MVIWNTAIYSVKRFYTNHVDIKHVITRQTCCPVPIKFFGFAGVGESVSGWAYCLVAAVHFVNIDYLWVFKLYLNAMELNKDSPYHTTVQITLFLLMYWSLIHHTLYRYKVHRLISFSINYLPC